MRFWILFLGLLPAAVADNLDLTYSVTGDGGISQPLAPISSNPFWWIDTKGTDSLGLANYGFNPLLDNTTIDPGEWHGSTLLSSPFDLQDGEALTVMADVFSNTGYKGSLAVFNQAGFALLLQNSNVMSALLFDVRAD